MNRPIVHVFPESVFLPLVADLFESVAPGQNAFLVFTAKSGVAHHKVPGTAEILDVGAGDQGSAAISEAIASSTYAIFHSVGRFTAPLLANAPDSTLTVWSGWGGDYYGSNRSGTARLLSPQTAKYQRSQSSAGRRRELELKERDKSRLMAGAARASAFFSAPIPEDFKVFSKRFRGFRGQYHQLNYATVEDTFAPQSTEIAGEDILLGNSATPANNHLDVLELLARVGINGRRIIAPLSYGTPAYADAVEARGTELFGSDFVPIREFMPLPEYRAMIAGCSVVVMGHQRQQALGNIGTGLWSGAHVVLSEKSPSTAFFRGRGAKISTLRQLSQRGLPRGRADAADLEANRRMLSDFWSRQTVLENISALLKLKG